MQPPPPYRRLFIAFLAASSARNGASENEDPPLGLADLTSMADYLRDGDVRLFRPSPTESTHERQRSGGCEKLPSVLDVLNDTQRENEEMAKAVEVVALCTTDHPENREVIGSTEGLHDAIVALLDGVGLFWKRGGTDRRDKAEEEGGEEEEGEDQGGEVKAPDIPAPAAAAANAAELAWILSFNSATNTDGLVSAGAVEALARIISRCNVDSRHNTYELCTPHVRMWAAAALQNLAASYCDTEDGRCEWVWTDDGEDLILHEDSTLKIDGSKVRDRMVRFGGLAEALVQEACMGSVRTEDGWPNPDVSWPGEDAEINRDELSISNIPWAAAGALKNLALSAEGRDQARPGALCLCALSASPDWLESAKAKDALYHMGIDEQCHYWEDYDEIEGEVDEEGEPVYVEQIGGYCMDWAWSHEDEHGNIDTCVEFDEEEKCQSYGFWNDADGVTANDACCMCGGGDRVDEPEGGWEGDEEDDEGDEL